MIEIWYSITRAGSEAKAGSRRFDNTIDLIQWLSNELLDSVVNITKIYKRE